MATKRAAKARKRGRATKARKRTKRAKAASRRPKRAAKPKARRTKSRATKARTAKPVRRAKAKRPAPRPAAAPRAAVAVAAAAPEDGIRVAVVAALHQHGYGAPTDAIVSTLTAMAVGYRQGPAETPPWLHVDADGPVASGMVERFELGDRAHDIDRSTHRPQVRATVNYNLDLVGGGVGDDAERAVITSFCLGSWNPAVDANAERDGIASFVVPWYLAGRA